MSQLKRWLSLPALLTFQRRRLTQVAFSVADQVFSVSGMFVANVALARTVSKEEYGMFALACSGFTFLAGLHNAAILETYTVYGAGRYSNLHPQYKWLIWRSNALLGVALTLLLLLIWRVLSWTVPTLASRSLLGLALSSGVLLTASLARRMLYVQRQPRLAAKLSVISFSTLLILLWLAMKLGLLNSLSVFLMVAFGWIAGGMFITQELPRRISIEAFTEAQPNHWSEHWKYARWVLSTAFVFQLTTQGYYWLVAGVLSLKEVAELRAIYILVMPVSQVFAAITLLILPMMAARYASKQIGELISLWKMYLLAFLLAGASFASLVLVFGSPVIHRVYGGKFDDVSTLLGTLALLPVLTGIGDTMNAVMKSVERPNMVLYAYLASGAATFVAGIPLVMHFGLRGAAYGMLVSASVYALALGIGFLSVMPRLHSLQVATGQSEVISSGWSG